MTLPLRFRIGARTLWSVKRRLHPVIGSLADALVGRMPVLPPLGQADGWSVTSLPVALAPALISSVPGVVVHERQRYTRYYVDLTMGAEAWWAGLGGATRSGLKRKARKAGEVAVHRYRTPDELAAFHGIARAIAAKTYQERLLGAGLPEDPAFVAEMLAAAAADQVRAWTLDVGGVPAAYLYCPVVGEDVIYDYVGHDPAFNDLSVGTLLQIEALRDLFAEAAHARYDFTEGEGQHKRTLSTGGVACVDLLLLQPTLANRLALAALKAFDGGVGLAKRAAARAGLETWARKVRRG
jgi:CelD/BcsL family acetyltransferase involved in cellulose biosynthesis